MPNKKKLLIAGGGYADIPMIQAAQRLGFHVITSGNRPDDLGHLYSDESYLEDFSNKQAMLKVAEKLKIDAICACCNDFSAITASYVAESMGLPGHDPYDTSLILHHKDSYRQLARNHGIATPNAMGFGSIDSALKVLHQFRFPVIVKPVDLTGGKGISKVVSEDSAKGALGNAFEISRVKRVVVEEFLEGSKHGLSTFIRDGKVVFHFHDNEHYYLNPYMVSAASTPGVVPVSAINQLCQTAEKISALLNLKNGIFHIQYILVGTEPVIIEICRRPPGDLYTRFVQLATGVDYPACIIRSASGMDCGFITHKEPKGFFTRHCVMLSRVGYLRNVNYDPSILDNIIEQFMWWKPGDQISDYLTQKLGIVFMKFQSKEEMLDRTERMQSLIRAEWL